MLCLICDTNQFHTTATTSVDVLLYGCPLSSSKYLINRGTHSCTIGVLKFNIGNRDWPSVAKTNRLSADCQNPSIGATLQIGRLNAGFLMGYFRA